MTAASRACAEVSGLGGSTALATGRTQNRVRAARCSRSRLQAALRTCALVSRSRHWRRPRSVWLVAQRADRTPPRALAPAAGRIAPIAVRWAARIAPRAAVRASATRVSAARRGHDGRPQPERPSDQRPLTLACADLGCVTSLKRRAPFDGSVVCDARRTRSAPAQRAAVLLGEALDSSLGAECAVATGSVCSHAIRGRPGWSRQRCLRGAAVERRMPTHRADLRPAPASVFEFMSRLS